MTFLEPNLLWGLPLILVPVIIHMLNRMRHRPIYWAAMQFLLAATRSSTNQAKLKQWLILLFRVLAVAALVLYLGRPLGGGVLGWAVSAAPDNILILLDRSSSMELRGNGDSEGVRGKIVKSLAEAIRKYEGKSRLLLLENVRREVQSISGAEDLLTLALTAPSDTSADIPGMMQSALSWLVDNRAGTTEIWIGSDLQSSNWKPDDERWKSILAGLDGLAMKVRVRVLSMAPGETVNASVVVRECIRRRRGDTKELVVSLELNKQRGGQEKLPLTMEVDGVITQLEIPLSAESLRYRAVVPLAGKEGGGWGRVSLPSDSNPSDNVAYFVYDSERTNRVDVVSSESIVGRIATLGFESLRGNQLIDVKQRRVGAGEIEWDTLTVLCWQGPFPEGAAADRMQSWIEEGGVVLFFPPGSLDSRSFLGMAWGGIQDALSEEGYGIGKWEEEEGLFARSDEGISIPLQSIGAKRRQVLIGEKLPLVSFLDGETLFGRRTVGKGQIFVCTTLPLPGWSKLGEGLALVPISQRLIVAGGKRFLLRSTVECGEMSSSEIALPWEKVASGGVGGVQVSAGVYRSDGKIVAINRPGIESDEKRMSLAETLTRLQPLSASGFVSQGRSTSEGVQAEFWRLMIIFVLIAMVVESVLVLPRRGLDEHDSTIRAEPKRSGEGLV